MMSEPVPSLPEEPWEGDLGHLLGQMPAVEPPDGFIEGALDHRPLYAGRILASLVVATLALVGLVAATGIVERGGVVPPIDDLVLRHDLAARAGLPADVADDGAEQAGPLSLPDGFQREGTAAVEDVRQAVYARGDESVSVFVQDGPVAWSALPASGLTELGGLPAWVDAERRIAVIETAGSTISVVGLAPAELDRTLGDLPGPSTTLGERIADLAESVVEIFGYAPAG